MFFAEQEMMGGVAVKVAGVKFAWYLEVEGWCRSVGALAVKGVTLWSYGRIRYDV